MKRVDAEELVKGPGKFQGEQPYVPHFWELSIDGSADDEYQFSGGYYLEFHLTASDREDWPELEGKETLRIVENDSGFVYEVDWTPEPQDDEDDEDDDDA